jgi:hypothetical protein
MRPPAADLVFETGGLRFVRLGAGALAIGHRPRLRALIGMRDAGVTHIATILAQTERPDLIGAAAHAAGLKWKWIAIGSTKNLPARAKPEIKEALRSLAAILAAGGRIYLHCSAGIHRTGMIAAALLYHLGRDAEEVDALLAALRSVTASGVGPERIQWARSFAESHDAP